jgi:hypothetical protein
LKFISKRDEATGVDLVGRLASDDEVRCAASAPEIVSN